jgi:hypothetical protein
MRLECALRLLFVGLSALALVVGSATPAAARGVIAPSVGSTPEDPVLPDRTSTDPPFFEFLNPVPGLWYDPPLAEGYTYELTGGATFTEVIAPPASFGYGSLDVFIPGTGVVGTALPGVSFDLDPYDSAVFSLLGVDPPYVDVADPTAFPTFLDWTGPATSLTMTPILVRPSLPEPATFALLALAGAAVAGRHLRRKPE